MTSKFPRQRNATKCYVFPSHLLYGASTHIPDLFYSDYIGRLRQKFKNVRCLRFSSDADIVRLTNARIIIIIINNDGESWSTENNKLCAISPSPCKWCFGQPALESGLVTLTFDCEVTRMSVMPVFVLHPYSKLEVRIGFLVPKIRLTFGHGVKQPGDLDLWLFDLGTGAEFHPRHGLLILAATWPYDLGLWSLTSPRMSVMRIIVLHPCTKFKICRFPFRMIWRIFRLSINRPWPLTFRPLNGITS